MITTSLPYECLKHRSLHCKLMFWRKETSWTKTLNLLCCQSIVFLSKELVRTFLWHFNREVKSSLSFWYSLKLLIHVATYTCDCSCIWKLLKMLLQSYHHTHTCLTTDIHEVHFFPQIEGASLGRQRYRGTAVSNNLEWLKNERW